MKKTFFLFLCLAFAGSSSAQRVDQQVMGESPREVYQIDKGWKFYRGHLDQPKPKGHHWVYKSVKAGAGRGPAAFQYDDGGWRTVDLPHDYVVEGTFTQNPELVSHGFLDRPEGWYRRKFRLPAEARGKTIWLYFDGVFGQSQVWVNGQELRKSDNGYIGFRVDISDVAHYGDRPNVISVKCDPGEAQGWWYEGGGIYRHVWLTIADPVHVAPYGVYISADKKKGGKWQASIETAIENESESDARVKVVNTILDKKGKPVAVTTRDVDAKSGETTKIQQFLAIPENRVEPWDLNSPNLYGIRTELFVDGKKVDSHGDHFGFRTLEFNPQKGFFLNGKPVKFKGVCMHQDHAGVGVALPDAIHSFRITRLKQFGVNAYRCSHNPPAPEILDACDRQGMLVLNENRFFNSGEDYLRQLDEQVRRDRNHPSVMMWSTFNEEDWQGDERGVKLVKRMKRIIDAGDHFARRPVTGRHERPDSARTERSPPWTCWESTTPWACTTMCNKNLYPNKLIYSSESVSHMRLPRGRAGQKTRLQQLRQPWVGWGELPPQNLEIRGYAGMGCRHLRLDRIRLPRRTHPRQRVAVISSYFGIVDTCGFAKDSFYLMQALWTDKPMAHVFPPLESG